MTETSRKSSPKAVRPRKAYEGPKTVSLRLRADLWRRLNKASRRVGMTKTRVISEALDRHLPAAKSTIFD